MVRRFDKNMDNEQVYLTVYSGEDREAEKIADVELHYQDSKLTMMILSPAWEVETCLVLKNKKQLGWIKKLGEIIEEMFSVTGHRGFETE